MIWIALVACKDKGGDVADSADAAFTCAALNTRDDPTPPDLDTDAWTFDGEQPPATRVFTMVQAHETGTLFVGSDVAGSWRTQDDGETYEWMHADITHNLGDLYAAGDAVYRSAGGRLQRSLDDGARWDDIAFDTFEPGTPAQLVIAISGPSDDGDRVDVMTSDGTIWRSEDQGETLVEAAHTTLGPQPDAHLHLEASGFRMLGPSGETAALLATPDGVHQANADLSQWSQVLSAHAIATSLVRDPSDPDRVVIGDMHGDVHRSADGGDTWETSTLESAPLASAWSPNGTLVMLLEHTLAWSTDGGATFETRSSGLAQPTGAVFSDTGRLLVAEAGGMWLSDDDGQTLSEAPDAPRDLGMATIEAHPTCPSVVVVGSRCSGGVFSSNRWGEAWDPADLDMHYVMRVAWDPTDPGRMWAVSDDGLYRWDHDLGWFIAYTDAHFHGFAVHPQDGDQLLIGSVGSGEYADETGRVYKSEDGGATWSDSSAGLPETEASMHTLLVLPDDPEIVLLGTYRGGDVSHLMGEGIGMFRSTDGGASWTQVDGMPDEIAWLTDSPRGAVAATDDGLWESVDGGATWSQVSGPTGWILGVDSRGDVGLALERTGRSWKSTDGGASWTELPASVPTDPTNYLAAVTISADASTAWATAFGQGVWRIGLD